MTVLIRANDREREREKEKKMMTDCFCSTFAKQSERKKEIGLPTCVMIICYF